MRKLMCTVLTIIMVISTFTPCFAATINDMAANVDNPMDMELPLSVGAKLSNNSGEYQTEISAELQNGTAAVDYQAKLDMASVRAVFDKDLIKVALQNDAQALAEFNAAPVTSTIVVTITYPNATDFGSADVNTVGVLNAGTIFKEVSRVQSGNTLTITYDNSNNGTLTAGALTANVNDATIPADQKYLKDITFTLDNVARYNAAGIYTVSVALSGSTTIGFTTRNQVVNYTGSASSTVTVTSPRPSGGSMGDGSSESEKATIKFDTNGGTAVDDVTVETGTVITAPVTTREGYTFDGWYTDASFTTKFDFANPVTADTTFYAKWVSDIVGEGDKIILVLGDNTINVFGTDIEHDVPPEAVDNRTMLPIRIIAENLGATVEWDIKGETATIAGNGVEIKLTLGDKMAYVNGEPFSLDVEPYAKNDRIYLPVRFVSEFLGAKVEWIGEEQKVVITRYGTNEMILTIDSRPAYVFGTIMVNDVAPVAVNNRTLLPIRFVVENLSGTVDWNAETQTVTINKDDITIVITIGEKTAYVNGEAVELDVAAFAQNNRTYLPLRFVAENLNANVEWVPETQSVVITKK